MFIGYKTNRAEKENIVKHKQDDVPQGKQRTAEGGTKQDGVVKFYRKAAKAGNAQPGLVSTPSNFIVFRTGSPQAVR